jgi:hypothetical protein
MTELVIKEGDIVQLDPSKCPYGAVIGVVKDADDVSITIAVYVPQELGASATITTIRAPHGAYAVCGRARWLGFSVNTDLPVTVTHPKTPIRN